MVTRLTGKCGEMLETVFSVIAFHLEVKRGRKVVIGWTGSLASSVGRAPGLQAGDRE